MIAMWVFYNAVMWLVLPLVLPFLLLGLVLRRRYRAGLRERLGFLPKSIVDGARNRRIIWVHAVSVGEVQAVAPLFSELRKVYPDRMLVLSTVTVTGRVTGEGMLPEADARIYFPFDVYWIVRRVVRSLHPDLFIFVEVEIWPNLLFTLKHEGIPAILVNGRISPRSFRRYRILRPFFSKVLDAVTALSVQGERDLDYALRLGAPPERTRRTGNMKVDQASAIARRASGAMSRPSLGLDEKVPLWIAASTHPGEEGRILSVYERLLDRHPDLALLLAPRHPERLNEVEAMTNKRGLSIVRKTRVGEQAASEGRGRIILLDTMGELAGYFGLATVTFVGGSLVPSGGHNILEPAAFGVPVIHGTHMENFKEIAALFEKRGASIRIADDEELYREVDDLLRRSDRRSSMADAATRVIMENRGAVRKNLEWIGTLV